MASAAAGDDAMGGAAGGTIDKKSKRISDYLADSDGADEAEDAAATPSSPSPETLRLRILPGMFTCARFRFVGLGRKSSRGGGGRKEVVAADREKSEAASVGCSSGSNAGSSGSAGMGLGLLFFLAKTCVELNKMAEVRARMEALLEEMRGQLATTKATVVDHRHHADAPRAIRGGDRLLPSTASQSCAPVTTETDTDDDGRGASTSSAMEMELASTSDDADDAPSEDDDAAGAGRYQLNCNSEHESSESSSDGGFIELDGGFGAGDHLRPRDTDSEEDEEEEHGDGRGGVSALELERRLHELLHWRSRVRIEELELSLRRAQKKLVEKEMEARLWKDTAQLALQPRHRRRRNSGGDHLLISTSTNELV